MSARLISIEWLELDECILTVEHTNTMFPLLFSLFGSEPTTHRYRGSGTVWHDAETGKRQGVFTEGMLCDIWTKEMWKKEDAERARKNSSKRID
jgi:hypothetical protein